MKIEIYGEPRELEKIVRLKLFENLEAGVTLAVVDAAGQRVAGGAIVSINEHGIKLHSTVPRRVGLPLDDNQCVKVINQ